MTARHLGRALQEPGGGKGRRGRGPAAAPARGGGQALHAGLLLRDALVQVGTW